jgi:hypothetical protein
VSFFESLGVAALIVLGSGDREREAVLIEVANLGPGGSQLTYRTWTRHSSGSFVGECFLFRCLVRYVWQSYHHFTSLLVPPEGPTREPRFWVFGFLGFWVFGFLVLGSRVYGFRVYGFRV